MGIEMAQKLLHKAGDRDPDEMRPVRRTRDTVFRRFNFFKKGIFSMSNV